MIEKLIEHPQTIDIRSDLIEVLTYFRHNKEVLIVPVIDDGKNPFGILRERDFKEYVYSMYGKEVLLNRSIKRDLKEFTYTCAICDINTGVDEILETFTREENRDGILITSEGKYFGLLSTQAILKLIHEKNTMERSRKSLDSLVVGFAHEINTPLSVGITASSSMLQLTEEIEEKFASKKIKKSDFKSYIEDIKKSSEVTLSCLSRAASLIDSVKKVSIDREGGEKERIDLIEYTQSIIKLLKSKVSVGKISVEIENKDRLETEIHTSLYADIITILITNSINHAFPNNSKKNKIRIAFDTKGDYLRILYQDNGVGIKKEHQKQIFDPFFTTKRGSGHEGLGLHRLENIITKKFGGSVECSSDKGVVFDILVPIKK